MSSQRITMMDIARELGVSKMTVSMALRNNYHIPLARRQEIKRTAQKMGYVPDPFLSALAAYRQQQAPARHHGVLAWINHWQDPHQLRQFNEFNLYWVGASEAAAKFGYRVDEIRWEQQCSPKRMEKILLARGIEGVMIPPHHALLDWEDFDWTKFSVVRFGLSVPSPDANVVTADIHRATVMAISKIREYGYRRIGLTVNGEFVRRVGGNFLSGYFYAQHLLNLQPAIPPLLTIFKSRTADELARQKKLLHLWLKKHQPDALLISDREVPAMIRDLGYRIPEDIAVAGTSVLDIPGADTGIDQRAEAIGRTAAETLLKQMNVYERGAARFPVRILVEGRWKDGGSLPPRGKIVVNPETPVAAPSDRTPEPYSKRVTLKEIADRAGVSKNTVSLALRDKERISAEMRAKIKQLAAEMGYAADPILNRLAEYRRAAPMGGGQGVIAWLNHWHNPEQLRVYHEFEQYWRGAKLAAQRLGYRLEEFIWPSDLPAKSAEQRLLADGVLGLLIPPHKPDVNWGDFDWSQFSLMRFGLSVGQVDSNLVTSDHHQAMMLAAKKMHDHGYGRIGLIYDALHDRSMGGNIYGGAMWAFKMLGIQHPISPLNYHGQNEPGGNLRALKDWMQTNQPDAVLTTLPEIPAALHQLGCQIPSAIAAAGTSVHDVPLDAGIDQCPHAIGQIAAEMLIKQISINERGKPADPYRILVHSRWQNGMSLPPRQAGNILGPERVADKGSVGHPG